MADLKTQFLGLSLKHPLIPGASPLSKTLDGVKKLEDAGAPAMVLYSLFEEQLKVESDSIDHFISEGADTYAESLSYFPNIDSFNLGPQEYLEHVQKCKETVEIPIIASLNGVTTGGWMDYAKQLENAGADALELNIYYLPTNIGLDGATVEKRYVDIVEAVKKSTNLKIAVKLSPFFSSIPNISSKLVNAGADALVLFNRFYQPNINIDQLTVEPHVELSSSAEKEIALRWIAILHGRTNAELIHTTGIHTVEDVVKVLMAGANAGQVVSALLKNGLKWLDETVQGLNDWLEQKEYDSVQSMIGCMSQKKCAEPAAFERANYMKALVGYQI